MFPRSVAELGPRSEKPSDIQLFPTSDPRVKPEDDGLGSGPALQDIIYTGLEDFGIGAEKV
jgi:hypothetical protein